MSGLTSPQNKEMPLVHGKSTVQNASEDNRWKQPILLPQQAASSTEATEAAEAAASPSSSPSSWGLVSNLHHTYTKYQRQNMTKCNLPTHLKTSLNTQHPAFLVLGLVIQILEWTTFLDPPRLPVSPPHHCRKPGRWALLWTPKQSNHRPPGGVAGKPWSTFCCSLAIQ